MSAWYAQQDKRLINYGPGFRIGTNWFRGDAPQGKKDYFVILGAAQAFGRLREKTFGEIVAQDIGVNCVNLGQGGASFRLYLSAEMLQCINSSVFAIVTMVSGRMSENAGFQPEGSNRWGIANGRKISADEFWRDTFKNVDELTRLRWLKETRATYVREAQALLKAITVPKLLLWFGSAKPSSFVPRDDCMQTSSGGFPHFVGHSEVNCIKSSADVFVDAHSSAGLPEILTPDVGISCEFGGLSRRSGWIVNTYYPSTSMHLFAASKLLPACLQL